MVMQHHGVDVSLLDGAMLARIIETFSEAQHDAHIYARSFVRNIIDEAMRRAEFETDISDERTQQKIMREFAKLWLMVGDEIIGMLMSEHEIGRGVVDYKSEVRKIVGKKIPVYNWPDS
jgi:hypothetical protein